MKAAILLMIFCLGTNLMAQQTVPDTTKRSTVITKKWFESINIRGYAQVRYNGLLQTNEDLECEQCDKSWGGENGFFIRRMRIIFFGQIFKTYHEFILSNHISIFFRFIAPGTYSIVEYFSTGIYLFI